MKGSERSEGGHNLMRRRGLASPGLGPSAVVALLVLLVTACAPTAAPSATAGATQSAAGSSAATSSPAVKKGGSLTIGMGSEPLAFDPPSYKATTDLILTNLIFDGLVGFDHDLNIVPGLAMKWEQKDPTTWHFDLRTGVKFSDGTAFTGKDVKASLERGATKPRGTAYIGFIKQVNVIDDHSVDIITKTPFGAFLKNMATPVAAITSADYLAKNTDDQLLLKPLGTGPFMLKQYTPKQSTIIVPNPNYWGEKPYLDQVTFQVIPDEAARYAALQSGQLDVIESPPPQEAAKMDQSSALALLKSPATRDLRLGFQVQDPVLKNEKLRAAIAHAVDAKSLVQYVVEGMARYADNGWLPSEVLKTTPPASIPYDVELAKKELADAGYPDGKGLTLELATPQGRYLRDKEIAEAIQQQLKQIGITVNLKTMEWGAYLDYLGAHKSQLFILGWGNATGDPGLATRQNFYTGNAFNFANYSNPDVDKLIDEADASTDQAKRVQMYSEITKTLLDHDVLKPIYWKYNLFAAKKSVHDFVATPLELIDVTKAWVSQ